MQRSKILIILLAVSIILKLAGKIITYIADISLLFGFMMYLYFVSTKAMEMLNRQFETVIFKRDFILRSGFIATPFIMFVLFDAYILHVFSSNFANHNATIDETLLIPLSAVWVFLLSVFFSWRLGKKHLNLVESIFKKIETKKDAQISVAYIKSGGIKKAYMVWAIGLILGLLALVFFFFWSAMYIIDYAYLAFLIGWMIYEAGIVRRVKLGTVIKAINKSTEMKEDAIFWQTFTKGLISNVSGVSVVPMIIFSIIMSGGFLVVSSRHPPVLLSWVLFSGWYLLIMTIQMARRLNQILFFLAEEKRSRFITTANIPYEKSILLTLSILFAYAWISGEHFKVVFVERLLEPTPLLPIFILANLLVILSAIKLCKNSVICEESATLKSYIITKAKLALVLILSSLLFSTAFVYAVESILVAIITVLLFCFENDFKLFFPRVTPLEYALVSTVLYLLVVIGLITTIQKAQNTLTHANWNPIILPLSLIWIFLVICYGIASYIYQRDRLNPKL